MCKDVIRKAKAWTELNLARDVKNKKRSEIRRHRTKRVYLL